MTIPGAAGAMLPVGGMAPAGIPGLGVTVTGGVAMATAAGWGGRAVAALPTTPLGIM